MTLVTLAVAVVFSLLAFSQRNAGAAFGLLIMSMLIWPEFLRVPIAIIQMSVPRFVAIVLLFKFIAYGRGRKKGRSVIDRLVLSVWVWTVVASVLAGAEFSQTSQMIGRGLDSVLMYYVARMALSTDADMKGFYRVLAATAMLMCVLGVYEAITWKSPYHRFVDVAARIQGYSEIRFGMLRAQGSTQNSIYFGLAMSVILGMAWSFRGYVASRAIGHLIALFALMAALSSLSSGPWLAVASFVAFNFFYQKVNWIKPTLWLLLVLATITEVASNRHFYHLVDYLALDPHTAWYRTRLLEIAISQWRDYWLVGVGSAWPHHWASLLDGREYIDVVNNFVIIALYGGLPALVLFICGHVIAIKMAVKRFNREPAVECRMMVFGLAATLLAIDFAGLSVGLFGPSLLLSHIVLGLLVSLSRPVPQDLRAVS
jgi:hypothetical protein